MEAINKSRQNIADYISYFFSRNEKLLLPSEEL